MRRHEMPINQGNASSRNAGAMHAKHATNKGEGATLCIAPEWRSSDLDPYRT